MASKYNSVDDYINQQNDKARIKLMELREYILSVVPEAQELINYGVASFALIKGGKTDKQIMIAAFRNHVGIYPGQGTIDKFSEELKVYKQGQGSVHFSLDEELPSDLILRMLEYRYGVIMNEES